MEPNESQTPNIGVIGMLRWAWRQLTSMRTALILLMLLGVAAIPGSLFPQRSQNPQKVDSYFTSDPTLAKWMDRLHFLMSTHLPGLAQFISCYLFRLLGVSYPAPFRICARSPRSHH